MIMYNYENEETFHHIDTILSRGNIPLLKILTGDCIKVLIGNALHAIPNRQVSYEEGEKMAISIGAYFTETNCATGEGIKDLMWKMITWYNEANGGIIKFGSVPEQQRPTNENHQNNERKKDCKIQ